jgi:hypothetical protein
MTKPLKDLFSIESIGQQLAFRWRVDFLCETEHLSSIEFEEGRKKENITKKIFFAGEAEERKRF